MLSGKIKFISVLCIVNLVALCGNISFSDTLPKRIVSLSPSITESIYLLGEENKLVGVTTFCIYPRQAKLKDKIGTIMEPSIEKIVSLKPDLVLATSINSPEIAGRLSSLGIKTVFLPLDRNYKDICDNFLRLGRLLGKEKKARDIISQSDKKFRIIKERVKKAEKLKVFWIVGVNPLITAGKDSFPDEIIRLAGGINIAGDLKLPYSQYNKENVLLKNPDLIVFINGGEITDADLEEWKHYKQLNAVKSNRIYTIDAHLVSTPVPSVYVEGLEQAAKYLHPEVFQVESRGSSPRNQ